MKYSLSFVHLLSVFLLTYLLVGCTAIIKEREKHEEYPVPPYELLEDKYQHTSHVVSITLSNVEINQRIYSDDGTLGYVVLEVTGIVQEVYKGDFTKGQEVTYYSWIEWDPNWEAYWQEKAQFLVFLNQDITTDKFWAIEVGQFRLTPKVEELIEKVAR